MGELVAWERSDAEGMEKKEQALQKNETNVTIIESIK